MNGTNEHKKYKRFQLFYQIKANKYHILKSNLKQFRMNQLVYLDCVIKYTKAIK